MIHAPDQLLFIPKLNLSYFTKRPIFYEEVNCTEPFPSVRVPWFERIVLKVALHVRLWVFTSPSVIPKQWPETECEKYSIKDLSWYSQNNLRNSYDHNFGAGATSRG